MGTSEPARDRFVLGAVLLVALAARLWILATQTYIAHPDETFQYLEPAHRLAFGSGVITWEYLDGIRSWLLPGAIAGAMRAVAVFDPNPDAYILVLRALCVCASLSVPYAGFRLGERCGGVGAGVAAGLLCALSPQGLYFAPVVMSEPLAADAALLAIVVGEGGVRTPRRLLLAGALFGLACALRYQYAPILAIVVLWQYIRNVRAFGWVVLGGAAVVAPALGLLDAATWGAPFQSVWLNFLRNGPQGVSQAMGVQGWPFYLQYFAASWGAVAPVLLVCLYYGARRSPVIAILVVGTIGLHSFVPHKELRFIYLAMVAIPMLIGFGLGAILERFPPRWSGWASRVGLSLLLALAIGWSTEARTSGPSQWHRDRSLLKATEAARNIPDTCGLAIRSVRVNRTGGYTYWHRNVPIFFETWDLAQQIPESDLRLRIDNTLLGQPVPQYPAAELAAHWGKFNVLIGMPDDGLPGFTQQACFGVDRPDDRRICVFTRAGGCRS